MRTLCSSTLIAEFIIIGLAALAAMRMTDVSTGTLWAVSGTAMALSVLLCGMVTRPGAVQLGWVLQAGLIASGFLLPVMFILGPSFAALWWASVHYGRQVDAIRAARAAASEAPAQPVPGVIGAAPPG